MAVEDQKIEAIEEEIKVLKGEVRRTLVDLRALVMREDSPLSEHSLGRRAVLDDLAPADEMPATRKESTETIRQETNERPAAATAPPPPPNAPPVPLPQDPAIAQQQLKLAEQERRMEEQERKIAEQEKRLAEASRSDAMGDQTNDRKQDEQERKIADLERSLNEASRSDSGGYQRNDRERAEQERKIADLERSLAEASRSDSSGDQKNDRERVEQERRMAELERSLAEAKRVIAVKDEPGSANEVVTNRSEITGMQPTVHSSVEEEDPVPSDTPNGPPPSRKRPARAESDSALTPEQGEADRPDSELVYEAWASDRGEDHRDEENELERRSVGSPRTIRRIQPERPPRNSLPDSAARAHLFDAKEEPASNGHNGRGSPVFDEYFELMELAQEPDPEVSGPSAPVDLNLMASLARWASIAKHRVGEERLSAILDLYFQSRLLSPGLRELLNRISQMADELPSNTDQTSQVCADLISHLHGILTGGLPLGQIAQGMVFSKD